MSAVTIGSLLFSNVGFAAIVGIAAFAFFAWLSSRLLTNNAADFSFGAVFSGIIAARFGHVLLNWETFAAEPLRAFAFWQSGFSLVFGLAGLAICAIVGFANGQQWFRWVAQRSVDWRSEPSCCC